MYAVVRTYTGQGASDVFDLVDRRSDEVRDLFADIPGFVAYTAARNSDGGVTVTVCQDKAGTDESVRRAADFVKKNLSGPVPTPTIGEGETVLHFAAGDRAGAQA